MKIFNITFNHRKLYFFGLILTVISLPLSKFTVSVSMIFLVCNWMLELDFKRKWQKLKTSRSILIFIGFFLVHLLWLINTEDFQYGFKDINNKAKFLIFPIIIGTSGKLSLYQVKTILIWFTLAILSSTIISTLILVQVIDYPIENIRDISPFISHIRLSLLINISIFSLGYIIVSKKFKLSQFEVGTYLTVIVWFIIFLYLLRSLTGIVIFLVLLFFVLAFMSVKIKELAPRLFLQVSLIAIFLLIVSFFIHSISKFYSKEIVDFENLEGFTLNGNVYKHFLERDQIENGNYVWLYVCEEELEKEWNKISKITFLDEDKKGQKIQHTLLRYLSSRGFRKDSVGISKLSSQDIRNIENGMANYIYEKKYALYPRIYDIIWQIDVYKKGLNPAGNSITLRIELAKNGIDIIRNNFWFGVGTGDVKKAINDQFEINKSRLPQKYRLRAHNLYITFFLTFGLVGSILIWFCIFYPVFKLRGFRRFLFTIFFVIALLSFVNEDTLETHIGITFFSYFYSLFLFGININDKNEVEYEQKS